MIKNLFSSLIVILVANASIKAQCGINTVSTDPDRYGIDQFINDFDWRQPSFDYYKPNGDPGIVPNPFHFMFASGQPNISHFSLQPSDKKDYEPKNGWELVGYFFGTPTEGTNAPFLILYNRYTSVLRVFVCLINTGNGVFNAANLRLEWDDNTTKTAILNSLGENANALDSYIDIDHSIPNTFENAGVGDNELWFYGDFDLMYDACQCNITDANDKSILKFQVELFENTEVRLEARGSLTTPAEQIVQNGNNDAQGDDFMAKIADLKVAGEILQGDYKKGAEMFSKGVNAIDRWTDIYDQNKEKLGHYLPFNDMWISNTSGFLDNVVDAVAPGWVKVAFAAGRTLVNVLNKKLDLSPDEAEVKQPVAKVSTIDLKITGTLQTDAPFQSNLIRVPASNTNGIDPTFAAPIYNNALGVFNLMEAPVMQETPYLNSCGFQGDVIYRYHFDPNLALKYVFNPASQMEIVDIKTSLLFETSALELASTKDYNWIGNPDLIGFGPDFYESYEDLMNEEGYTLLFQGPDQQNPMTNAQWSTSLIDPGCVSSTEIITRGAPLDKSKIKIRVILQCKPVNPYPNTDVELVSFIYTFPVKIESIPYNGQRTFSLSSCVFSPYSELQITDFDGTISNAMHVAGFLNFEDETIISSENAVNDILIGKDVIFDFSNTSNIEFKAGNSISLFTNSQMESLNLTASLGNEINLIIEPNFHPCSQVSFAAQNSTEISNFCSSVYLNNLPQHRIAEQSNSFLEMKEIELKSVITSNNYLVLSSENNKDEYQNFKIYDISGKIILDYNYLPWEIDVSKYSTGIYILEYSTINGITRKKMKF
jgi:hypothetical protein